MEIYQDFEVSFKDSYGKETIFRLLQEQARNNHWNVRNDIAEKAQINMMTCGESKNGIICIETPKIKFEKKDIGGFIWMRITDNSLKVFNIISTTLSHLSCAQYNRILLRFEEKIIDPLKENYTLTVIKAKALFEIKDHIGEDGFKLLLNFSTCSNKSTGHSHPVDFEKWCDFIFYVYDNKCQLSSSDFQKWLTENGWDDEMAHNLAIDYEYSLDLLRKYYEQDK